VPDAGAPEVDREALDGLLASLAQGDVLDVGKIVVLWSPDSPSHPAEVADVQHDEPVMTRETHLSTGLSVIVSQDCDLARDPAIEPYVVLAPLTAVDERVYAEAERGMSARYFAYPDFEGHADHHLVLDARVIQSLEKLALLSPHIERRVCPLSEPRKARLREWLGQRFGRTAFPDEIVRQVIDPIDRAVKQVRAKEPFNRTLACVIYVGLRWTPGKAYCSLLLLSDPSLREHHKVGESEVTGCRNALGKALNQHARRGDYTIVPTIHDATEVAAAELLQHHELQLDLDPIEG
jgi:hypothetical protein